MATRSAKIIGIGSLAVALLLGVGGLFTAIGQSETQHGESIWSSPWLYGALGVFVAAVVLSVGVIIMVLRDREERGRPEGARVVAKGSPGWSWKKHICQREASVRRGRGQRGLVVQGHHD